MYKCLKLFYCFLSMPCVLVFQFQTNLVPITPAVVSEEAPDDVTKTEAPLLRHHAGEGLAQADGVAGGGLPLARLGVVVPHQVAVGGALATVVEVAGRAAGGVHVTALGKRKANVD